MGVAAAFAGPEFDGGARGVEPAERFIESCPHCGTRATRRLGECHVCHRTVCEHCGNVQYSGGARQVTHRECLRHNDEGFKMIKFVR